MNSWRVVGTRGAMGVGGAGGRWVAVPTGWQCPLGSRWRRGSDPAHVGGIEALMCDRLKGLKKFQEVWRRQESPLAQRLWRLRVAQPSSIAPDCRDVDQIHFLGKWADLCCPWWRLLARSQRKQFDQRDGCIPSAHQIDTILRVSS